jgi:hypothetical protein
MDRAASLSLLSFLVLTLCCLSGCDQDTAEPGSAESSATTSEGNTVDNSQQAPTSKDKAAEHKGPGALPLNGEPKLLLSEVEIRDGWFQLFDGQTLSGWTPNNDVDWHVTDDGVIEASQGEPGLLLTTVPFADFEFRCEYWVAKDGNSGIFLRTAPEPTNPTKDCYEFNIFDSRDQSGGAFCRIAGRREVAKMHDQSRRQPLYSKPRRRKRARLQRRN